MDVTIDKYTTLALYVLDGDYGLPSVDAFSMEMILNIKLNDCKRIEINKARFHMKPDLPKLIMNGCTYTHPEQIRKIIEKVTCNKINKEYSKLDLSRLSAYFAHSERFIAPAMILNAWATDENAALSASAYAKGLWFPFNVFYARNQRKKMKHSIDTLVGSSELNICLIQSYGELESYFKDLSNLLGEKLYFLGDHPTTLDLYLCSNLAGVLRLPFPNNQVLNVLNGYPNIVAYVNKFLQKHAPHSAKPRASTPVESDRASMGLILSAGLTSMAVMALFAWNNGLLRFH